MRLKCVSLSWSYYVCYCIFMLPVRSVHQSPTNVILQLSFWLIRVKNKLNLYEVCVDRSLCNSCGEVDVLFIHVSAYGLACSQSTLASLSSIHMQKSFSTHSQRQINYSFVFYSILLYYILFCSFLFYSILFYYIPSYYYAIPPPAYFS
jgi:hypothetical protein